ncbi:MAG: hypothetical protein GTO60_16660 [Gammaproteobacteria bacterium]|nr:hypothetical protein [Gammaproteobacteria bacterium]
MTQHAIGNSDKQLVRDATARLDAMIATLEALPAVIDVTTAKTNIDELKTCVIKLAKATKVIASKIELD